MKEHDHYSNKGSHKKRSDFHNMMREVVKNCNRLCYDCPAISDCGVIYEYENDQKGQKKDTRQLHHDRVVT